MMLGQLAGKGYTFTDDEDEAEIAVVNSCCFINDAKEESINTILQLAERKKEGQLKALIVCGCLAQRYADEMQAEIPEVDAIVGTTAFDSIAQAVEEVMEGCPHNHLEDINRDCIYGLPRSVTTGGHYAYLKIAEGCNKRCTYCVIPSVRGNYRSVPMESLVREARTLVAGGAKELILVAQETTIYGVDLYGEKMLPELLRKVDWQAMRDYLNRRAKLLDEFQPEEVLQVEFSDDGLLLAGRVATTPEEVRSAAIVRESKPRLILAICRKPVDPEMARPLLQTLLDRPEFTGVPAAVAAPVSRPAPGDELLSSRFGLRGCRVEPFPPASKRD